LHQPVPRDDSWPPTRRSPIFEGAEVCRYFDQQNCRLALDGSRGVNLDNANFNFSNVESTLDPGTCPARLFDCILPIEIGEVYQELEKTPVFVRLRLSACGPG